MTQRPKLSEMVRIALTSRDLARRGSQVYGLDLWKMAPLGFTAQEVQKIEAAADLIEARTEEVLACIDGELTPEKKDTGP